MEKQSDGQKERQGQRDTERGQLQLRVTLLHRNNEIVLSLVYTANKIILKTITVEATAFAFLRNYFSDKIWPFRSHVTDGRLAVGLQFVRKRPYALHPSTLSKVSPTLPLKRLQCSSE